MPRDIADLEREPMSSDDYIDLAIQPYQESPRLRFLVNLLPGVGGAIDAALTSTRDNLVRKRQEEFFRALQDRKHSLQEHFAASEPFVHRYLVTSEAVVREAERSKIELFANLLTNGPTEAELGDSDYKALLQTLNDLSARELALLSMLEEYEVAAQSSSKNELQVASDFWPTFREDAVTRLNILSTEFDGVLARLTRTGCYKEITGAYLGYAGGQGHTTGLWVKFRRFVLESAAKADSRSDASA